MQTVVGVAILDGGLKEFAHRTVGFQLDRDSPFSVWGLYGGLHGAEMDETTAEAIGRAFCAVRAKECWAP